MGAAPETGDTSPRRPIKARGAGWAGVIASRLARKGIRPNTISLLSVVCAFAAGVSVLITHYAGPVGTPILFVLAALFIQCRLLCNLFDGMVAIEGGFKTKSGEIFNDMPDRIADPLVLVTAGYAASQLQWAVPAGWMAGLLAVLTAYSRVLAGSTGAPQRFLGPMAKQHRMALMTGAFVVAAMLHPFDLHEYVILTALCIVVLGCVLTFVRRVVAAIHDLEAG